MREEMNQKPVQKLLSIVCIIGLIICIAGRKEQPPYPLGKNSLFNSVADRIEELTDETVRGMTILAESLKPPTSAEEAYTRMETGDWSMVEHFNEKEWLTGSWESFDFVRADINEDGVPELVAYHHYKRNQERDERPLSYIFSYEDGSVKMVFKDIMDASEYYFLGAGGKLIGSYQLGGSVCFGTYWQIQFDQQWSEKTVYYLSYDYFSEEEGYNEEEIEWLKEKYPDSYGAGGSGVYCYEKNDDLNGDDSNERSISEAEFHRAYEELTGFSFLENLPGGEWIWKVFRE